LGAGDGSFAKALAPSSDTGGAPLPKGGCFLNHDLTRSALMSQLGYDVPFSSKTAQFFL
jgi:hypothetical protein